MAISLNKHILPGFAVLAAAGSLAGYGARRRAGQSAVTAASAEIFNFALFSHPAMLGAQIGFGLGRLWTGNANRHTQSVMRKTGHFNRPMFDSQAAAMSQQALYQGVTMSQASLRLGGHSWAGQEAGMFHRRYG